MTDIRDTFPLRVDVVDPVWITMDDGVRLAATLWRPITAGMVPVVVELIPYRRRDGTVFRDVELHPWLAGHGIAYLRVDLRGSGDSDGILTDEYTPREQEDCAAVIAWAADQPWSNGNVGMCGISWGGFNALQLAARQPPALKAIITLCASDDRHSDDVHYMGGAMLTENISWSNVMMSMNALPPDPAIRPDWREIWQARLEANRPWAERWIRHATRDGYWRQGSICEDYSKVKVPVLAAAGWDDSYSNFVLRLIENLSGPRLGILGPWSHAFPCRGTPGPHIGWLQESVRWWRHWLCGEANGIMEEARLRVFVLDDEPISAAAEAHAGRWLALDWPSGRHERIALGEGSVRSAADAGIDCGRWGGYGGGAPDLPLDQRAEDARALCFDLPVLREKLTLIGRPLLSMKIGSDQSFGTVTARLCSVAPDGASRLISYGVLNLARRRGMDRNEPMRPGEAEEVRFALDDLARDIPAGHHLRLALSGQHWPVLWPQPGLVTLSVAGAELILPVHPGKGPEPQFEPAAIAPPIVTQELEPGIHLRRITRDIGLGCVEIELNEDAGKTLIPNRGIAVFDGSREIYRIAPDDPLCASMESITRTGTASGPLDAAILARTGLRSDTTHFTLSWSVETRNHGEVIHQAGGEIRLPRGGL